MQVVTKHRAGVAILISGKIDIISCKVTGKKEEVHCILIEESIQQDDIIIIYMYIYVAYIHAHNNIPVKYMKQKMIELKGKVYRSTIIVGDHSTSL